MGKYSTLNINVLVVGARNLGKSGMFGKADPYIVVSHKDKKKTSATINNDLNPQWNFENTFAVSNSSKETLRFEVYDKDTVTKDDLMGSTEISITDAAQMKEGSWIPLQGCKSGELFVSVEVYQPKTGEEARLQAEADAVKAKQEEEAKLMAESEAAKAKQELEAKQMAEAEKARQGQEARLKAEAEAAKAKQEEEARLIAEAEKAKQEEEARLKAETEAAKAKREEEARIKAEAEAAKAKQEAERLKAETEAAKAKEEEGKARRGSKAEGRR